jgi:hypothetical protein
LEQQEFERVVDTTHSALSHLEMAYRDLRSAPWDHAANKVEEVIGVVEAELIFLALAHDGDDKAA